MSQHTLKTRIYSKRRFLSKMMKLFRSAVVCSHCLKIIRANFFLDLNHHNAKCSRDQSINLFICKKCKRNQKMKKRKLLFPFKKLVCVFDNICKQQDIEVKINIFEKIKNTILMKAKKQPKCLISQHNLKELEEIILEGNDSILDRKSLKNQNFSQQTRFFYSKLLNERFYKRYLFLFNKEPALFLQYVKKYQFMKKEIEILILSNLLKIVQNYNEISDFFRGAIKVFRDKSKMFHIAENTEDREIICNFSRSLVSTKKQKAQNCKYFQEYSLKTWMPLQFTKIVKIKFSKVNSDEEVKIGFLREDLQLEKNQIFLKKKLKVQPLNQNLHHFSMSKNDTNLSFSTFMNWSESFVESQDYINDKETLIFQLKDGFLKIYEEITKEMIFLKAVKKDSNLHYPCIWINNSTKCQVEII